MGEEGIGAAAARCNSRNLQAAHFSPPVAGLCPLPWERVLLGKRFLEKKPNKPKWLTFALLTALLQKEWLRPLTGRGHHQNCTRQPGHSLTCPSNSNWSRSGPKAALTFSAPSKPVPKTWSRAILCYQRPRCPSLCHPTSMAARNLLSKLGHCQPPWELALKTTCLCQTLPVNCPSAQACARSTEGTNICRSHLGVARVPVPTPQRLLRHRCHGRVQHGRCGSQEGYRKKIIIIYSAFLDTSSPTCIQHQPRWELMNRTSSAAGRCCTGGGQPAMQFIGTQALNFLWMDFQHVTRMVRISCQAEAFGSLPSSFPKWRRRRLCLHRARLLPPP